MTKPRKRPTCERCRFRPARGLARRVPGVLSGDYAYGIRLLWLCEPCFNEPWPDILGDT